MDVNFTESRARERIQMLMVYMAGVPREQKRG